MKKIIYIENAVKEIDSPEFAHTKQILEVNEVENVSIQDNLPGPWMTYDPSIAKVTTTLGVGETTKSVGDVVKGAIKKGEYYAGKTLE